MLITPYKVIRLDSLAAQLGNGLRVAEVEDLIAELIMDGRIDGQLDQLQGRLELHGRAQSTLNISREDALLKWAKALDQCLVRILNKISA